MKLRNKQTGEIGNLKSFNNDKRVYVWIKKETDFDYIYNSLAELNEEWEDVPEEPKEHWAIDQFGEPINVTGLSSLQLEKLRRIGNLFKSEEKTERAVEKLKAWQTAKDAGFKFDGWQGASGAINQVVYCKFGKASTSLLSFLFGGEE